VAPASIVFLASRASAYMTGAMLVIYCLNDLGLDPGQVGVAMGIGAVGGLVGALATPRLNRLVGEGRTIPLSSLLWIPAGVLMPLAGTVIPPMLALTGSSLVTTFLVVVYNVTQVSFRQRLCPRPLLGRMNAAVRFIVWGTMPLGALAGGLLGSLLGVRATLLVAALGMCLAVGWVLASPLRTMRP